MATQHSPNSLAPMYYVDGSADLESLLTAFRLECLMPFFKEQEIEYCFLSKLKPFYKLIEKQLPTIGARLRFRSMMEHYDYEMDLNNGVM